MSQIKKDTFRFMLDPIRSAFQPSQSHPKASFTLSPHLRQKNKEPKKPDLDLEAGLKTKSEIDQERRGDQKAKKKDEEWQKLLLEAEKIVREAEGKAQDIKNRAYQEGFQQGLGQGIDKGMEKAKKEGLEEWIKVKKAFQLAIEQIEEAQIQAIQKQEQEILGLCLEIAKKIVHTEIQQNRQVIIANLREGLRSLGQQRVVGLRLNPQDLAFLQDQGGQDLPINLKNVTIEADPGLLRGGCLIQTDMGYIDATIETRWEEVKKVFTAEDDGLLH